MIFFINPASTLTPLAFLYVLIIYLRLLVTKCILNSTELKCTQNIKLYHFVHTIVSVPFCPIPFCPYTILSIPFCPYHFVRYHFVRSPNNLAVHGSNDIVNVCVSYWGFIPKLHFKFCLILL